MRARGRERPVNPPPPQHATESLPYHSTESHGGARASHAHPYIRPRAHTAANLLVFTCTTTHAGDRARWRSIGYEGILYEQSFSQSQRAFRDPGSINSFHFFRSFSSLFFFVVVIVRVLEVSTNWEAPFSKISRSSVDFFFWLWTVPSRLYIYKYKIERSTFISSRVRVGSSCTLYNLLRFLILFYTSSIHTHFLVFFHFSEKFVVRNIRICSFRLIFAI